LSLLLQTALLIRLKLQTSASGFNLKSNPFISNENNDMNESIEKEIELHFLKSKVFTAQIYPNPNKGNFTLSIPNAMEEKLSIDIENIMGEILWVRNILQTETVINVDFLSAGLYLVHIKSDNQIIVKKVLIIN
jgi:hypothetical protein